MSKVFNASIAVTKDVSYSLECKKCGRLYIRSNNLRRHVQDEKCCILPENQLKCNLCKFKAKELGELKKHVAGKHKNSPC